MKSEDIELLDSQREPKLQKNYVFISIIVDINRRFYFSVFKAAL